MEFKHYSVLLNETIENLNVHSNGIYVDGTIGGGGHSLEILKRLNAGKLIGIDRDIEALNESFKRLKNFEKNNEVILVKDNHENIPLILNNLDIEKVDGIILDLGLSSYQIDNADRGFSYMKDSLLDMRMDQSAKLSAKYIVNNYDENELERIFRVYGEEKYSRRIAKEIVKEREKKEINTTFELVEIIDRVVPKLTKGHRAKKVFQALRIETNSEISNLEKSICEMIKKLKKNGRICIITFHSLEDKAVKNAFKIMQGNCTCPKDFPKCVCGFKSYGRIVNKKVILPKEKELKENIRSHSAKLRVFERN